MSAESHILSIVSADRSLTLFLTPAGAPGMVRVELRINGDRFSAPLGAEFPSRALVLAATAVDDLIRELSQP
jgi:hypothetical protein